MTKSVFAYRNAVLCAEAIPVAEVAEEVDTPFYCISAKQLQRNYRAFAAPFSGMDATVHYAVKANACLAVLHVLADCGAGADVTSSGELERALAGGMRPEKIVFSGVGKTRDDIAAALLAGVLQINAESLSEIGLIERVAKALGKTAPVALRVNVDVDALAHAKTSTGHQGVKFGIDLDQVAAALALVIGGSACVFRGFSVHVGSMLGDYGPFRQAYGRLADVVRLVRAQGIVVDRVDLGGGVGIPYDGQKPPPFSDYVAIVREVIGPLGCAVSLEPGRKLVGDAAALITKVVHVKDAGGKTFLVVDAGMNDLVRPAMYGARHEIIAVRQSEGEEKMTASVVGPVCETGDSFGDGFCLPACVQEGSLLAIMQAGAYGSSMASMYNGRPLVPEVLVSGAQYAVVRRRIAVAEQIGWEMIPDWMVASCAA